MDNCLVTKLKGVVDNDNLLKLGEMVVKFDVAETVSDDFLAITVSNTKPCVATVKNGTFMNSDYSASEGTEKSIPADTAVVLRVSNTGADVHITEKYTLNVSYATYGYFHKGIHFNLTEDTRYGYNTFNEGIILRGFEDMTGELNKLKGSFTWFDLTNCFSFGGTINGDFTVANDFNGNSTLIGGVFANSFIDKSKAFIQQISIQQSAIYDDIANFPVCSQLNLLRLSGGNKLYGNIANFPQLPLLQYLYFDDIRNISGELSSLYAANTMVDLGVFNTGITGSLEDFAQACVGRGRTSGTLKINLGGTAITYQGVPATNTNWYWTITFNGSGYTITSGW